VLEILSSRFPALGWAFVQAVFYGGKIISKLGSELQKQRYLPEIVDGRHLFSYALTEPNAGSDAAVVTTFAQSDGDWFVINGTKTFITGADVAGTLNMLVRTDKSVSKHRGLSIILVDSPAEGLPLVPLRSLAINALPFVK
jgi:alkylation response protein AidB-like acyl-CoA dehydrogenase